jgi:class 3 adenylate cyclase
MVSPADGHDRPLQESARRARLRERFLVPANAILAYSQVLHDQAKRRGPGGAQDDLARIVACAREVVDLLLAAEALLTADDGAGTAPVPRELHHDLRTPLSAIKGYAELLLEDGTVEARDDLERLIRRVRELLGRVEALGSGLAGGTAQHEATARELAVALAATADRLEPQAEARAAAAAGRVLVVDDHENNRLLLQDILALAGHEVEVAPSGAAGLAHLDANPVDLVLLDLLMPGMNGLEVLVAMRAKPALADLPVVVLSGVDNSDMIGQCLAAGAQDFIRKPFDATVLRARVAATLERKRLRDRERVYLARLDDGKRRAEALLANTLPRAVIDRLGAGERTIADRVEDCTVLFADIVGFTTIAARLPPARLVADLDRLVCAFDDLAADLGVEKIKTVGDAYLAVAGVPEPRPDHAQAAAELALRMTEAVATTAPELGTPYQLRVGLHTGPVLAGVIGRRKFSYDVWGDTVNIASRLQQLAAPGEVTISEATRAALPGGFRAEALGSVELRGRGSFETHRLVRAD